MNDDPARPVATLRAVTTSLRLGGLDTLRRSSLTHTDRGVVLTIPAGRQDRTDDR